MDAASRRLEALLLGSGTLEEVLEAIGQGADVRRPLRDGSRPLSWSIGERFGPQGSARCAGALLAAGARVADEPNELTEDTSVHRAAVLGYVDALGVLLAADGRVALHRFDDLGRSPLICAVVSRSIEAVQILLEAGADVDASDEPRAGNPPIRWATEARDVRMVRYLLRMGADPTKPGWMHRSALDRARPWRSSKRRPELKAIFEALDLVARAPERRGELPVRGGR
jgi:Ankyrin repeats (3 copies)